ncbi:hypothetical protein BN2497_2335 [Janthinobacterium sp. CG23_2]|nr:hypothetical protein BN2497_2335 [Janthinobacterium sp. CG23_2]CUU27565.1 hypothetical protein BN3177_2335 [Janthinobacterium sp. CG23_2]
MPDYLDNICCAAQFCATLRSVVRFKRIETLSRACTAAQYV